MSLISSDYIRSLKEKVDFLTEIKDEIIQKWIKINRFSKTIIYSLIRNDIETAKNMWKNLNKW